MIMLVGPLLVAVGAVCIIVAMFGILAWGFSGFG
jgi:hypothetical protein